MIKRKYLYFVLMIGLYFLCNISKAQGSYYTEDNQSKNKWLVGGGLGLQFGNVTLLEIAPRIGYKITDKWILGASISYAYYSNTNFIPTYETSIFGASVYSQYYIFKNIFGQVEIGALGYDRLLYPQMMKEPITVPYYLVGGGYKGKISESSALILSVLFNLDNSEDYPYDNPMINVGFQFGL
ncbi:MAG: hypothetical protein ACEPOV_08415 [Hyphomicrobiales bacterium]